MDVKAYPDPEYGELRSALSRFHHVPPDWILPGNGSAELLTWACRDLAKHDVTCLFTPAFGDYSRALQAFEAKITTIPLLSWDDDLADCDLADCDLAIRIQDRENWIKADRQIDSTPSHSTRGLLLNNPHNPTGMLLSREQVRSWIDPFGLVVVDEAFMDFLRLNQQQSMMDWVQDHPNLVILRSLTKFYSLPGLRLGYVIAHPDRLRRWQQWRDPWSVNALAVAAAIAVLQDIPFQQQTWDWLEEARLHLFQGLAALPGLHPLPGAANFLLVRSESSVLAIQRQLLQRYQILIRDCMSFAELGDRFFRVAVRTPAENQRLLDGLADILNDQSQESL